MIYFQTSRCKHWCCLHLTCTAALSGKHPFSENRVQIGLFVRLEFFFTDRQTHRETNCNDSITPSTITWRCNYIDSWLRIKQMLRVAVASVMVRHLPGMREVLGSNLLRTKIICWFFLCSNFPKFTFTVISCLSFILVSQTVRAIINTKQGLKTKISF